MNILEKLLLDSGIEEFNREKIQQVFRKIDLEKESNFIEQGKVSSRIGLVESGMLMYIQTDENGKFWVCDFAAEVDWVTHYQSVTQQTLSTAAPSSHKPFPAADTCC